MILVVVSTGHFDPLIQACNELNEQYDFLGQVGSSTVRPNFPHFKTCSPSELQEHMGNAELVVSHAGTGMLSMLYRLKKPSVIIPKQIRYGESNDGQIELAKRWGELGLAILCMDVKDLANSIERCRQTQFEFMKFPSLGKHLRSELGRLNIQSKPILAGS